MSVLFQSSIPAGTLRLGSSPPPARTLGHARRNLVRHDELAYTEVLARRLGALDSTAVSLCMDNDIPIIVFDLRVEGNISKAVSGEPIGTLVHGAV